jgi:hypothetical protein
VTLPATPVFGAAFGARAPRRRYCGPAEANEPTASQIANHNPSESIITSNSDRRLLSSTAPAAGEGSSSEPPLSGNVHSVAKLLLTFCSLPLRRTGVAAIPVAPARKLTIVPVNVSPNWRQKVVVFRGRGPFGPTLADQKITTLRIDSPARIKSKP